MESMEYLIGMGVTIVAFSWVIWLVNKMPAKPRPAEKAIIDHWEKAHELQRRKIELMERIADELNIANSLAQRNP